MFGFGKKEKKISFNILICVERDNDRYYAHCPSLKGIHVDGTTKEEALRNVKIATVLYIRSLIKHGDTIPLQIVAKTDLQEHCIMNQSGNNILAGYPHTELVQVPIPA